MPAHAFGLHSRAEHRHSFRFRRTVKALAALLTLGLAVGGGAIAATADDAYTAQFTSLSKTVNATDVTAGDSVTWSITVSCSSLTSMCIDAAIKDTIPDEFAFTASDVQVRGYEKPVGVTVSGQDLTVSFNETTSAAPGHVGMWGGQTAYVDITTQLRTNVSADEDNKLVTNVATATGSNAASRTASAQVTIHVKPTYSAVASKSWEKSQVLQEQGAQNTATLSFGNGSNVPVSSVVLTEPSTGNDGTSTSPGMFAQWSVKSLDLTSMPEGATSAKVEVRTGSTWTTTASALTSVPATTTDLVPSSSGIALSDITGIRITFTGSGGEAIAANGSQGSLKVGVTLRDGLTDVATAINNVIGTSVVQGANSNFVTADAAFTLYPPAFQVQAAKAFNPSSVVAGSTSVATISGSNASNVGVDSLSVIEPSAASGSLNLAEQGLVFSGFGSITWPSGATTADVAINYTSGSPTTTTVTKPGAFPIADGSRTVTGFSIVFHAADGETIPSDASFSVPFTVTAGNVSGVTTVSNLADVSVAKDAVTKTVTATGKLTITPKQITVATSKAFSPATASAVAGSQVNAVILSQLGSETNVPVDAFTVEDSVDTQTASIGSTVWGDDFRPVELNTGNIPNGVTATVYYAEGAAGALTWSSLGSFTGTLGPVDVPASAKGIKLVYTPTAVGGNLKTLLGTTTLRAVLVFAVSNSANIASSSPYVNRDVATATGSGLSGTDDGTGTVTLVPEGSGTVIPPVTSVSATKSWSRETWTAPDSDARATGSFTVAAKNTSAVAVDSLTLEDQHSGYSAAMNYLDFTGFTVSSSGTFSGAQLTFTLYDAAGGIVKEGSASTVSALRGVVSGWTSEDVENGVRFVVTAEGGAIQPNATLTVVAAVVMRDAVRGSGTPIGSSTNVTGLDNTVRGTVTKAGTPDVFAEATKPISITPLNGEDFAVNLSKSITNSTSAVYAQPVPTQTVTLNATTEKGSPWRYVIEDSDARFFNAFDFTGVNAPTFNTTAFDTAGGQHSGAVHYAYSYLVNGSWSLSGDDPVLTGGTWVEGAVDSTALPDGVPAGDVHGVQLVVYAGDSASTQPSPYLSFAGSTASFSFTVKPRQHLKTGGEVLTTDLLPGMEGVSGAADGQVRNAATLVGTNIAKDDQAGATADYLFTPGNVDVSIDKTPSLTTATPGTVINFRLTTTNNGSAPVRDPRFVDTIDTNSSGDPYLVFSPGSQTDEYSYEITKDDGATVVASGGQDDLLYVVDGATITFRFADSSQMLLQGETLVITVPMMVRTGTPDNTEFQNHYRLSAPGIDIAPVSVTVEVVAGPSFWVTKDVREIPADGDALLGSHNVMNPSSSCIDDGSFYKYPCIVDTRPGGTSQWRIRISNTGNIPSERVVAYDVFPHVDDTGVLLDQQRESEWSPYFDGAITIADPQDGYTAPQGDVAYTVYYQTAADPVCHLATDGTNGTLENPEGEGCVWHVGVDTATKSVGDTLTLSGVDPKDVTAIKIVVDFDSTEKFHPGEQVQFRYTMTNPVGTPTTASSDSSEWPAWNSVAVQAEADGAPQAAHKFQVIEPVKAGVDYSLPSPSYAVGDRVWIDANRDGVQDSGEVGLGGVGVTLTNSAGTVVGSTTTDENGDYLFEGLFPGDYKVHFALTEEQARLYGFTVKDAGSSTDDSDADVTTGWTDVFTLDSSSDALMTAAAYEELTGQEITSDFIDPTWDAGVDPYSVSVGDYVWKDANGNGIQDEGESGISGVVLTLTGPDGGPVTDVFGNAVEPVTTDTDGHYEFADLPLLPDSQHYTVTIDGEASADALAGLIPTTESAGSDRGLDSSTGAATSWLTLAADGDSDMTLDFGFRDAPLASSLSPSENAGALENTSAGLGIFIALLLLGAGIFTGGAAILVVARRGRIS